jgi:hypothetical protein
MTSLLAKALLGFLFLLGVLALFGLAGTLDYW